MSRFIRSAALLSPSISILFSLTDRAHWVKLRNPESPKVLATYSHPIPGGGQTARIELFMAPFLSEATEEDKLLVKSGTEREKAMSQALEGFRRAVLSSLVEETFHAKQHAMINTYTADPKGISPEVSSRVADYALNREFLVAPVDLKAYFDTTSAYENQPIESDAKKFRVAVVEELLSTK
jgi:hypothetical protein